MDQRKYKRHNTNCDATPARPRGPKPATRASDKRYSRMLRESARIGWPVNNADDLFVFAKNCLERLPEQSMLWILHENGTHLYPLVADHPLKIDYYRYIIKLRSATIATTTNRRNVRSARFYLVIRTSLTEITAKTADELLTSKEGSHR